MRKHRFFVATELSINDQLELDADTSHYISRVLRLNTEQIIYLFNNSGYEFTANIINISRNNVTVNIINSATNNLESPLKINLAQVIAKGEKMDLVIQKATELGVSCLVPLYSERTQIKNTSKYDHWQKVAIAASCQSGRNYVPVISAPQNLTTWLENADHTSLKLILSPDYTAQNLKTLKNSSTEITLLIGPEGGFSLAEIDLAVKHNFTAINLGPRILRTETAGIAAIAILQALYGDC